MDNVCHTLVGAACSEAGLGRRTRFGLTALLVASNLPDVDVLVFLTPVPSVAFRRGWTHGVLAQALLPVLLVAAFVIVDRRRRTRAAASPPLRVGWLLALSYLGVLSHVALDWMNTYGIRLLMPLSGRWYYGDTLFIVDPWLWVVLGAGVFLSRRRQRPAPARVALALAVTYVAVMTASAVRARDLVFEAATRAGDPPSALMVGPTFADPFGKQIIMQGAAGYRTGQFRWFPRDVKFSPILTSCRTSAPDPAAVERSPRARGILVWARFPCFQVQSGPTGNTLNIWDLRFGRLGRFGAATVDP